MDKNCFHGGASFNSIGLEFDKLKNKDDVIRSDVTDAWFDPCQEIISTLSNNLSWLIKNSPPTLSEGLINVISKVRTVSTDNLLVSSGSSSLMYLFFPNVNYNSVAIIDPMYGEYSHIFKILNKKINIIPQNKDSDFKVNVNDLINAGKNNDMIVIVNPNNPTGQCLSKKEIIEVLNAISKKTIFVIDETYIDYLGKIESAETLVKDFDNLVIIKSMSKIYALSGIRVAYMVASKSIIDKLKLLDPPWSVGMIGQLAGIIVLKNEDYYFSKIKETHNIRDNAIKELETIPSIKIYPSVANFVLIELKNAKANEVYNSLVKKDIFIRVCDSQSVYFNNNFIRFSIKDKDSTNKIVSALKEFLI